MKINEILAAIEWVEEWIHRNGLINIKLIFRIQIFSPRDAFYFDAINQCAQVFELPKKPVCSPQLFCFFFSLLVHLLLKPKHEHANDDFQKKNTEEIKEFVRLALDFHAFIIPNDLIFVVKNPRQYWLGFYFPANWRIICKMRKKICSAEAHSAVQLEQEIAFLNIKSEWNIEEKTVTRCSE